MAAGHVALNMAVCLDSLPGHMDMMYRTSSSKPMSSMRSASSRTRWRTFPRSHTPSLTRSLRRPGVQTTQSTPLRSASFCGGFGTPPYMTADVTFTTLPNSSSTFWDCMASSRVGASTSAWHSRRL